MKLLSLCLLTFLGTFSLHSDAESDGHNENRLSKRGVPSFPSYFMRRLQPRIEFGMQTVLPSVVNAVAGAGSTAVEAAQAIQVQAEPIVREGSAILMHTMDTKIIPAVKAGLVAVGRSAANGVEKLAGSVMGQEAKDETAQAFGTLARAIMPAQEDPNKMINFDDQIFESTRIVPYRTYGQDEVVHYEISNDDVPRRERDSMLRPKLTHPPLVSSGSAPVNVELSPRQVDPPRFTPPQLKILSTPNVESVESEENSNEEEVGQHQTIEEALYVLGKNILGRDVNDKIFPVAKQFAASIGSIGQSLPKVEFERGKIKLMPSETVSQKIKSVETNSVSSTPEDQKDQRHIGVTKEDTKLDSPPPVCTTPDGETGHCMGIQNCPILLANLERLRKSVCFQSLFSIGVCCPDNGLTIADFESILYGNGTKPDQSISDNSINTQGTKKPSIVQLPTTTRLPSLADIPTTTPRPSSLQNFPAGKVPGTNYECGSSKIPQARIVGGNVTYEGQYPWMVAIYLHGNGKKEFWCGGALVSDIHVLTAAHCTRDAKKNLFPPSQFTIKVGEWDLNDNDDYSHEIPVQEIFAHPEFRANGFYNDLAIFKLTRQVKFNEYIQPICLPAGSLLSRDLTNSFPIALGWGTTYYGGQEVSDLRAVALPVWTNEDCDNAYFQPITEVFLCAGFADGGKDACQGDSGGPLMLYDEKSNKWTLVGVVSFGNRCAEPGYPGVYTRLTHFMPWVLSKFS